MAATFYVGTSGWHYGHWRGIFYPETLSKPEWLNFYARSFPTVEINNSFYRIPTEKAFDTWRDATSPGFVFAVKVSRFITHIKRLKDTAEPLQNFLDRAKLLGEKLGPLLYQLPPNMLRDEERLASFAAILPGEYYHVFEFRHASWFDDSVYKILREHNLGLCLYDMPGFTTPVLATADFAYMRFPRQRKPVFQFLPGCGIAGMGG